MAATVTAKFALTTPAFSAGDPIPARFTCEGENSSPELRWTAGPENTRSFALIVEDPDAPSGTFTHWVLFDIPAAVHELSEGDATTGTPGENDFRKTGYGGPCPPPGHGPHRYYFRLHALDVDSLKLSAGATRQEVEKAMQGHVVAQADLLGRYERKKKG